MRQTPGIIVGAGVIIGALLLVQAWMQVDTSERNLEFFPNMAYSPAREAFTESTAMPAGLTQQAPVAGTVIRGSFDFPYGDGPEEAARAGREVKNPFTPADEGVIERGSDRYDIFCTHCHGNGVDPGPVALQGMVPPQSLLGERAKTIADGEMFHVITRGQGNMKAHGPQISPEDRWKIVLYVRALQGKGK